MNIIDTVQIKYFRSIMKVRLNTLGDVNVLTGRNDVGKSNVLKGLNLFFNNHVEWQEELDFYRDFSQQRLREVRQDTIKGKQFISVKIWFNRPSSYRNSLPERFAVKRTWDRNSKTYGQRDYLDTAKKQGDLPTDLTVARRSLTQLLNKIQFEYVPAVRDRSYFDHLLDRLQGLLLSQGSSSDAEIAGTAETLAEHVDGRISDLQQEFEEATGIHTEVEPPTDIASLFRAFGVSTVGEDPEGEGIPLNLRGDGIQGRYVPSVLNFIADRSGKLFVWGFEEPENSLEYGRVSDLAHVLAERYSANAQIFVTSHSPAFTSLRADNVHVYRAYRDDGRTTDTVLLDNTEGQAHEEKLRDELGLLAIEERVHAQYTDLREQLDQRGEVIQDLRDKLATHERPVVVVEGKWDQRILEEAWNRLRGDECPFEIEDADPIEGENSGGGVLAVRQLLSSKHLGDYPVVGLFDRDGAGIKQFEALPAYFNSLDNFDGVQKHRNQPVYGALLPTNSETEKYGQYRNLPIEFLFPDEALDRETTGGYGLTLRKPQASLNFEGTELGIDQEKAEAVVEGENRYLRQIESGKDVFAEKIVPNLEDEHFGNFAPVLDLLEELVTNTP